MRRQRLRLAAVLALLACMMPLADLASAQSQPPSQPPSQPRSSSQPPTMHYDCSGQLHTEDLADGGATTLRDGRWRISVNPEAGYVKRPPELAAGCVEQRVEICGCEIAEDKLRCRSLGFTPDGIEIAMDFTLDRAALLLRAEGRRQHARSGLLIETSARLSCEQQ